MTETLQQAVFLDRDGVLIENRDSYVRTWADVRLLPGSLEACRRVHDSGIPLVLVTNQALIGRGILLEKEVIRLNNRILKMFAKGGAPFLAAYMCPHHPDDECDCRKPKPGMLLKAAREHGLDLHRSAFVGDALTDLEAAKAAGARGILVRTGRGAEQQRLLGDGVQVEVYDDLGEAVDALLRAQPT